jgi:hypothetical protein
LTPVKLPKHCSFQAAVGEIEGIISINFKFSRKKKYDNKLLDGITLFDIMLSDNMLSDIMMLFFYNK